MFIHQYPVVQFKTIDGVPTVIGIDEGRWSSLLQGIRSQGETFRVLSREGFVQKILVKQIGPLGYTLPGPIPVETILNFRRAGDRCGGLSGRGDEPGSMVA
ncbi:hypothetical protein [Methanosphaerula palustris]|uniref:Cas6b N-terminal domain-containing protein n=1 Tax=Methanosphaerula palustris (strain ATCC BAA-1556 / DSM 19958 / E1-9c) TaxID=521011 RepID=B8GIW2_METPE|nr:hypothetical protein [Methanosphaerula palustris]ACL16925.1 hypothetical protein Mpal_1613 [Methanosphaerula palustris E1-9c]